MKTKKINILAWGSLIQTPGKELKKYLDGWEKDGPLLPIEFARKSDDGRLTLVIYDQYISEQKKWIQTYWSSLNIDTKNEAIEILRRREKCSKEKIGSLSVDNTNFNKNSIEFHINKWAAAKKIQAVIWTNLPSNFTNDKSILSYARSLKDNEIFLKAKEYICEKTPPQTKTPLRRTIESIVCT